MTKNSYKFVKYDEAQQNPEYAQFFREQFEERAARIIQHIWRKKHIRGYSTSPSTSLRSLSFIKEPLSNQMMVYAEHIQAGEWLKLNFADKDFVRHVTKALRLKLINLTQTAMAIMLYESNSQFPDSRLQQFALEEKFGPYYLQNVSYAKPSDIQAVKTNLKNLPPQEQIYFTIDFSPRDEAIFFFEGLNNHHIHCSTNSYARNLFVDVLGLYLLKFGVNAGVCEALKAGLLHPNYKEFGQVAEKEVLQLIETFVPQFHNLLHCQYDANDDALHSYRIGFTFLTNMISLGEQIPNIGISSNFNFKDQQSPVLCFILPHLSALQVIQNTLHGDSTTSAFFLAGKFTPRLLDKLDKKPEEYKLVSSARGVELYHPDVINSSLLHGGELSSFMITWHDLFHCWRNGSNTHKSMFRYLRNLFHTVTGYDMPKIIWQLIDMDTNIGWLCREAKKHNSKDAMLRAENYAFYDMLSIVDENFFMGNIQNDHVLLVLIDIIKNRKNWQEFSQQLNIFLENTCEPDFPWRAQKNTNFITPTEYRFIKEMMEQHPYNGKDCYIFYILGNRLRKYETEGMKLCERLAEIGFDKIVKWKRNNGLYLVDKPEVLISKLGCEELFEELTSIVGNNVLSHSRVGGNP